MKFTGDMDDTVSIILSRVTQSRLGKTKITRSFSRVSSL